jgi:ATP-binding cassette, subfamily B, bacterial
VRQFVGLPAGYAVALMVAAGVAAVVAPLLVYVLGLIAELMITHGAPGENDFGKFLRTACGDGQTIGDPIACFSSLMIVWLALATIEALALYAVGWSARQVALAGAARLRVALHSQSLMLGPGGAWTTRGLSPMQLFSGAVEEVRAGLAKWWQNLPLDVLLAVTLVGLAFKMHFWLTLAVLLLVGACWPLLHRLRQNANAREDLLADRAAKQRSLLAESLRSARRIDGLSAQHNGAAFGEQLAHHQRLASQQQTVASRAEPVDVFVRLACMAFILLLVGLNVLRDPPRITPPEAMVMIVALAVAYVPLRRLLELSEALDEPERAAAEIGEYLDRPPGIQSAPDAREIGRVAQRVELAGVTVTDRAGHRLLDGVSLWLPAGSFTAVLSSDPGLVQALTELFPRCHDPAAGQILLDGADIRTVKLDSLRSQVALVRATDWLTTGTVSENIGGGKYSADDIADAARKAGAYDFIQRLPQGFDTVIGEHGIRVSAEESFRLSVAHALLRNPSLVIIEEPAEDPDYPPEHPLDDAIAAISEGRTVLAVARRISTLRQAQRVLLFHEGRLYADGTHAELLQKFDLYRHLSYVRFNEFRGVV